MSDKKKFPDYSDMFWEYNDPTWVGTDDVIDRVLDRISPYENDMVNSPSHYTSGRFEAIDVIEDAIEEAPNHKAAFLQAQVLKYLLRLWHKIDAKEDAEKARWYLNRLIDSLN